MMKNIVDIILSVEMLMRTMSIFGFNQKYATKSTNKDKSDRVIFVTVSSIQYQILNILG